MPVKPFEYRHIASFAKVGSSDAVFEMGKVKAGNFKPNHFNTLCTITNCHVVLIAQVDSHRIGCGWQFICPNSSHYVTDSWLPRTGFVLLSLDAMYRVSKVYNSEYLFMVTN